MKNEKSVLRGIKWIVIIVIIFNFLSSFGAAGIEYLSSRFGDDEKENYHDVRIISASSEKISNVEGISVEEGYSIYRFQVTVENMGTYVESPGYQLVYVESGDGYAYTAYEQQEMDDEKLDTRILPPGRQGVITVYGKVSDDSSEVDLITYQVPGEEAERYTYVLPAESF